jgi:hypothetical protein
MAFFSALGLPDAAALGPAFVLLKRAKEIFWIALGYAVLFFAGGRPRAGRTLGANTGEPA